MEEVIKYQEPKCTDVFDLTERELRRLHGILVITTTKGNQYYDRTESHSEETQKWARDQISHFHKALTTPIVFCKESR